MSNNYNNNNEFNIASTIGENNAKPIEEPNGSNIEKPIEKTNGVNIEKFIEDPDNDYLNHLPLELQQTLLRKMREPTNPETLDYIIGNCKRIGQIEKEKKLNSLKNQKLSTLEKPLKNQIVTTLGNSIEETNGSNIEKSIEKTNGVNIEKFIEDPDNDYLNHLPCEMKAPLLRKMNEPTDQKTLDYIIGNCKKASQFYKKIKLDRMLEKKLAKENIKNPLKNQIMAAFYNGIQRKQ